MKTLYKAGYIIRITSWENNGDHYNTQEVNVETEEKARAVVAFANLFKSRNRYGDSNCIGNIYEPTDIEQDQVANVLIKFNDVYGVILNVYIESADDDEYNELIYNYYFDYAYNLGLTGGDFYTRVCDKIEVLYLSQEVVCEDRTKEFTT